MAKAQQDRTITLASLMRSIKEHHVFNNESYPGFEKLKDFEQRHFAIGHSALHLSKSVGRISGELESYDHGAQLNLEELRLNTVKLLMSTLRLASLLALEPDEIAETVDRIFEAKKRTGQKAER